MRRGAFRFGMLFILSHSLSLSSQNALANEAVFVPLGASAAVALEALQTRLSSLPGVQEVTPVFDSGEILFLKTKGEAGLAHSVKIKFEKGTALETLRRSLTPLQGVLQSNPRMNLKSFNSEQWALQNTGVTQEVVITDILSRMIRSVPGEDAGVMNAPPEIPGKKILVAVVDTGVDALHPALASRLHQTTTECQALEAFKECLRASPDKGICHERFDRLDTDGNGYPLDCSGWNLLGAQDPHTGITGNNTPTDDIGHGTHVSGIIAGTGFISGIATEVEILPVKVLGLEENSARTRTSSAIELPHPHAAEFNTDSVVADVVARGILYALRSHAQIINLSLGYSLHDDSELMRQMVALAQRQGVLVVASAGNEASQVPVYPCRYAGVICVASFSADGSISHFSDFGDSVDLAAPGHHILSSWPTAFYPSFFTERKGYDFKNGTSMATPFVVGALARLINHGFSSDEAVARLLLGTRPSLVPSIMPELTRKFTFSGNLDLARAFEVVPQALIVPALKEPVLLPLDRMRNVRVSSAEFRLGLRNLWKAGAQVRVQIAIAPESTQASRVLRFKGGQRTQTESVDQWNAGELHEIQGTLTWDESVAISELPGDFYLEITVSGLGMNTRTFKKAAGFFVPIRPLSEEDRSGGDAKIRRIPTDLSARSLPADYTMKPISCLQANWVSPVRTEDLLLISKTSRFTTYQLLQMTGAGALRALKKSGGAVLETEKEKLTAFSCLDYSRSGGRGFALTTFNPVAKKFAFSFYDSAFREIRALKLEFSSDTVAVPEEFRWLSLGRTAASPLFPAWVARGRRPLSELPTYDPWERRSADAVNPLESRFYFLTADGLHTLAAPEGYHFVGFLKPTAEELQDGSATVLLFHGQDYFLDFFTAKLRDLKLGALAPLQLPLYHRLVGLKTLPLVTSGGETKGTAFVDEGAVGGLRISIQGLLSGTSQPDRLESLVLEGTKLGDSITRVIGLFAHAFEAPDAFFRSRFELYFRKGESGEVLATELKQYDEVTRHLPAWVDGQPALLLPEGQGSELTTEVILPKKIEGRLELFRPASLKTWGLDGCELIQMLSASAGGASPMPERLIYFCGDHFVSVEL